MDLSREFKPETAVELEIQGIAGFEIGEAVFDIALRGRGGVSFLLGIGGGVWIETSMVRKVCSH